MGVVFEQVVFGVARPLGKAQARAMKRAIAQAQRAIARAARVARARPQ